MKWMVLAIGLVACTGSKETDEGTDSTIGTDDSAEIDYAATCVASGGTVVPTSCCQVSSDWGVTGCDGTGACGCSPDNSHIIQVCECPAGTCFNPDNGECG